MQGWIITISAFSALLGGCYSARLSIKSPHMDGEYWSAGWVDSDDSDQGYWPAYEGSVAVLGGCGSDCVDLHDSEVRRLPSVASSDSRRLSGLSHRAGFLSTFQESKMLENLGFSIAAIIVAYAFGAATGPSLWAWMKSRGK
jgi:hypothetical protein